MIIEILTSVVGFLLTRNEMFGNFKYFGLTTKQQSVWTQISIIFFLFLLLSTLVFEVSSIILVLMNGLLILFLKLLSFFTEKWIESALSRFYLEILDEIILSLQVGFSVKSALQKAIQHQSGWRKHLWRSALDVMNGKTDLKNIKSRQKQKIFRELCDLSTEKYKVLDSAKSIRDYLRLDLHLRRRSRQITQQVRTQAALLSLFYLAGAAFLIFQFGIFQYKTILLSSFFLFLTGVVLMFWLARRSSWNL